MINRKERYLQATGIAWQGCKKLENCQKNNKDAAKNVLTRQNELINDAFSEISEVNNTLCLKIYFNTISLIRH